MINAHPPWSPGPTGSLSIPVILPLPECPINGIVRCPASCCRPLPHGVTPPTLTPLDARISCSPLVISDCTWMYHGVFMHLPAEGHFSYFQFGAIMTNAVVNVCVHVFVWTWVFIPLDKSPEIRFWVMCKLCVCNCKEPPSCWPEWPCFAVPPARFKL